MGGVHVTTMSNSNASCFRVELSWVALGFDNFIYMFYYFRSHAEFRMTWIGQHNLDHKDLKPTLSSVSNTISDISCEDYILQLLRTIVMGGNDDILSLTSL